MSEVTSRPTMTSGDSVTFPVVCVGASAGGLDVFKQLLKGLPIDSGLAYVLVQHLDPTHESMMVDLLSRCTEIPVLQASDNQKVLANHIYMIPPDRELTIHKGHLVLGEAQERKGVRMSIDTFMRSLAADQLEQAVGIVLSGTGTDGTLGLQAIKAAGGLTLTQDPATASHGGMPMSAVQANVVDEICDISRMPELLLRHADPPHLRGDKSASPRVCERLASDGKASDALDAILALLLARRGVDFRHYKRATLVRRIERRIGLNQLRDRLDYLDLLRSNADELHRLGADLMINVTAFFRDTKAYEVLTKQVIAPLVAAAGTHRPLRIWVAGCSTGEEAYSLAIAFHEAMLVHERLAELRIFASDIDEEALATARTGVYPAGRASDLGAEWVARYFERDDGDRLRVRRFVRESVTFARQNVVSDPPFSSLDLISCRNLMIYLRPSVQEKMLGLFHFALRQGGYLFLGGSEGVDQQSALFQQIDKPARLFQRTDALVALPPRVQPSGGKGLVSFTEADKPVSQRSATDSHESHDDRSSVDDGEIEAMESYTEELRASNEEVMSINEELQSTNEELETSKEELQSLNEELISVNSQLQEKLLELEEASNDITNLLNSSDIATLFLDHDLRIKRFTPAATELFSLITTDVGRPLTDLAHRIRDPELIADARRVLKELVPVEIDVESAEQQWFTRRVLPYRTHDNRIGGVVVTFSDITRLRRSEQARAENLAQLQTIYRETPIGLCFNDTEMRYEQMNTHLASINDVPADDHLGKTPAEVLPPDLAELVESQLKQVLHSGEPISDLEVRGESPSNSSVMRDWLVSYHPVKREDGEVIGVSTAIQDITAQKLTERRYDTARAIGRLLVGDRDFHDTVIAALHRFVEYLGVSRAEYWERAAKGSGQPRKLWRVGEAVAETMLRDLSESGEPEPFGASEQAPNDDLIGRAWSRKSVSWIVDVSTAREFPRAEEARRRGLITGMAVPIVNASTGQVNGVIALFLDECLPRTEVHVQMLETVARDLAEYRRRLIAERAAQRARIEFKALTDNIPDIVTRFDRQYRHLYVNPAISQMTGRLPAEFIGRSNRDLGMPEALCNHWDAMIGKVFETDAEVNDEFELLTPEGKRYFRIRLIPEHRDDASTSSVLGVTTDITEHRTIERSLAEREITLKNAVQELDNLYSTAPVGLCVLDQDLRIVKINETLARMHRKTPDQLTGLCRADFNPELAERLDPLVEQVLTSGQPLIAHDVSLDFRREPTAFAERVHWQISYIPLGWQNGKPVSISCTVVDVTQQKRTEVELQLALQKADSANQSKSEFLANMSHEIRSPLTAILGHAEILGDRLDDESDRKDLATIGANGQHLLSLLNDFLDLAKIESGVIDVRGQVVNLEVLVTAVFSLLAGRAREKRLGFEIRYLTVMPEAIVTDAVRLRQILINLLSNAIKFTDSGHVRLAINAAPVDSSEHLYDISFAISDTGVGIPDDQKHRLFEPFVQADTSVSRRYQGSGLGLTISRRLAQRLGGDISIESKLGMGSTFTLTIRSGTEDEPPLVEPADRDAPTGDEFAAQPRKTLDQLNARVVVVDDQRDIRDMLVRLLWRAGVEAVPLPDGRSVLGLLSADPLRTSTGEGFDALIVDMQMPGMDGYQTVRQLREHRCTLPILALTAAALSGEREQCLQAGCDDYLRKPVDSGTLLDRLARLLKVDNTEGQNRKGMHGTESSKPIPVDNESATTASTIRLLMVDDNEDSLTAMARLLGRRGYQVVTATTAQQALAKSIDTGFDIALVDIGLPDMDGRELATALRADSKGRAMRIIALSGHQRQDIMPANGDDPFDHWLTKPARSQDIVRTITALNGQC